MTYGEKVKSVRRRNSWFIADNNAFVIVAARKLVSLGIIAAFEFVDVGALPLPFDRRVISRCTAI
jgi:hypothetical protein